MTRHLSFYSAVTACLLMTGCGGVQTDYSELDLKEISGTVTLDGDPVEGAVIVFEAEDKSFSSGVTDDSGYYELMFNSEQSGVLDGPKIVRIGTSLSAEDVEADEAGTDGGEAEATTDSSGERVPACYNSESQLRVTVSESTTMNFDLKPDCTTKGPASE